jgi:NarL family two-component system response regulator LiaR
MAAAFSKPIRIMLVDDNSMVRDALKIVLEVYEDIQIVAEAGEGNQAVSLCRQTLPNVVLMDVVMPGQSGIEATRLIRTFCPDTQVVALTALLDESDKPAMIQAGAIRYLTKSVDIEEIVEAIRFAASAAGSR